ncbi:MAG: hypothetical protein KDD42_07575 [Bdellovibrionales bacterium]|nr:hypothetical protein [Bdellovibrionales bacterium]
MFERTSKIDFKTAALLVGFLSASCGASDNAELNERLPRAPSPQVESDSILVIRELLSEFAPSNQELNRLVSYGWSLEEARRLGAALSLIEAFLENEDPRPRRFSELRIVPLDSSEAGGVAAFDPVSGDVQIVRMQTDNFVRVVSAFVHEGVHACAHREVARTFREEQFREIRAYEQQIEDLKALQGFIAARHSSSADRFTLDIQRELQEAEIMRARYTVRADLADLKLLIEGVMTSSNVRVANLDQANLQLYYDRLVSELQKNVAFGIDVDFAFQSISYVERSLLANQINFRKGGGPSTDECFEMWRSNLNNLRSVDFGIDY